MKMIVYIVHTMKRIQIQTVLNLFGVGTIFLLDSNTMSPCILVGR